MHNILITSAGKRVALVRAFKETLAAFYPNTKVFTTDMNPDMAPAAYVSDGCFKVPRVTEESYIRVLISLCLENHIGLVVPTIDTELLILAQNRDLFAQNGICVSVSDSSFITLCRDKRNTGDFFLSKGVRIPKPIDKYHPIFPLFAKPYDGSLSKDLYVLRSQDELTPEILNHPKLIFMEYIDKSLYKEYTVDMYYGGDGELKMAVPRERIEIRAGEINKGRSVKGYLLEYIKSHLWHIDGCFGCICAQFFYDEASGDVVGIEINPRFGGGYPLSYAAGANYAECLIRECFKGETLDYSEDWKENLLMLRYDDAVYV